MPNGKSLDRCRCSHVAASPNRTHPYITRVPVGWVNDGHQAAYYLCERCAVLMAEEILAERTTLTLDVAEAYLPM